MTNAEKLLPCPFCGGKAYFHINTSGYKNEMRLIGFQIKCAECGVLHPETYELEMKLNSNGEIEIVLDEREDAIQAWNKRSEKCTSN